MPLHHPLTKKMVEIHLEQAFVPYVGRHGWRLEPRCIEERGTLMLRLIVMGQGGDSSRCSWSSGWTKKSSSSPWPTW